MPEFGIKPHYNEALELEVAKIDDPREQAVLRFYYNGTERENVGVSPRNRLHEFEKGIAHFNGADINYVDDFVEKNNLITNYSWESMKRNGLIDGKRKPLLEAFDDVIESVHEHTQDSATVLMAIHPSLASPISAARSVAAAYQTKYGKDIRSRIYVVYGAYPAIMEYSMRVPTSGERVPISPVDIGMSLANLVLTAPKTTNTITDDSHVQSWNKATREVFLNRYKEILAVAGSILILHPSGRRGQRSNAKSPPYYHKEFLPEGSLDYLKGINAFIFGIDDDLLINQLHPQSIVNIKCDPNPREITSRADVINALVRSAEISSSFDNGNIYKIERHAKQKMRLGKELLERFFGCSPPNVE